MLQTFINVSGNITYSIWNDSQSLNLQQTIPIINSKRFYPKPILFILYARFSTFLPLRWWTSFFRVFNEIEDNINCVYANICLVQFIDTPQISVFRGDQQISLKVRTNIIRATSVVTLQRSIIETNRYWSAFDTEKALFTLMWIELPSTICFASWGSIGTQGKEMRFFFVNWDLD